MLEDAFVAFRNRQRELQADESCSCQACRSVGNLDLKIVAHHGRFLRQMVGDRSQAAGVNVVLAHRLLKNGLAGQRAYILLTDAALRWAGVSPTRAALTAHTERYEHFGDVRYFVKDLGGGSRRATEGLARCELAEPAATAALAAIISVHSHPLSSTCDGLIGEGSGSTATPLSAPHRSTASGVAWSASPSWRAQETRSCWTTPVKDALGGFVLDNCAG